MPSNFYIENKKYRYFTENKNLRKFYLVFFYLSNDSLITKCLRKKFKGIYDIMTSDDQKKATMTYYNFFFY